MSATSPIYAVRLREPDKLRGFTMRSYTSAAGNRYVAGTERSPSTLRIVSDPRELAELREIPQFEILSAASEAALRDHLQVEMESRARVGMPAVRAAIMDAAPAAAPVEAAPRKVPAPKALETILAPTPVGEAEAKEEIPVVEKVVPPAILRVPDPVAAPEPMAASKRPSRSGGRKPKPSKG